MTRDRITVTFYTADGPAASTYLNRNSLAVFSDPYLPYPACSYLQNSVWTTGKQIKEVTHVIVETNGSDGFLIDEARLVKQGYMERVTWGKDGGTGWCLSTDPRDGSGAWGSYVEGGCYSKLKFDVKTGKVTPVGAQQGTRNYSVKVKTGNTRGGGTNANISMTLFGDKGEMGPFVMNPLISGNAFEVGNKNDVFTLKNKADIGNIMRVRLYSDGYGAGSDWSCYSVTVNSKEFLFREWINKGETAERSMIRTHRAAPGNVAKGKPSGQSSVYGGAYASRANDGKTAGNYQKYQVSSTNKESGAWWEVDLGDVYDISSINIYNRTDCCPERLSNYSVLVSKTPFRSNSGGIVYGTCYGKSGNKNTFRKKAQGRYVRLFLRGNNYLSLAEVEVIGTK